MPTLELIEESLETRFFVDIGASDCPSESQSEKLLEKGWSGVMFEADPVKYNGLSLRMKDKSVTVLNNKVTPDNILSLLESVNTPDQFYLSLDIDGYDYFVLDKILSNYHPELIVSEINEKIPPPIRFTVLYNPKYWWNGTHFYGYSLAMLEPLLHKYTYKIQDLDYNNVVLIPGTQTESLKDVYDKGYWNRNRFYYNADFEPIYSMNASQQEEFIKNKFKAFEGQYLLNDKLNIENTGQIQLAQPFGQWISKYAADTRFQRYLEVGTWNGRGSTCCFYDGFATREDIPTLDSYEINESRFKEASTLWQAVPQIRIKHGRILQNHQCPVFYEVKKVFPHVTESWHTEDIKNFWACSYFPIQEPEVVLLDGAEYLTYFEFQYLKDISSIKVFLLDDTSIEKCTWIYNYLSSQPDWKLVAGSPTERNGWAVFERV